MKNIQINEIQNALNILLQNGCDIYLKNNAGISPINFSLSNQCYTSFSRIFHDHHKSQHFLQTLTNNEYLWPMIISNVLSQFCVSKGNFSTFGRFIIGEAEKDRNLFNLLKSLSMETNANGDLPIEFYIKLLSSKH